MTDSELKQTVQEASLKAHQDMVDASPLVFRATLMTEHAKDIWRMAFSSGAAFGAEFYGKQMERIKTECN